MRSLNLAPNLFLSWNVPTSRKSPSLSCTEKAYTLNRSLFVIRHRACRAHPPVLIPDLTNEILEPDGKVILPEGWRLGILCIHKGNRYRVANAKARQIDLPQSD